MSCTTAWKTWSPAPSWITNGLDGRNRDMYMLSSPQSPSIDTCVKNLKSFKLLQNEKIQTSWLFLDRHTPSLCKKSLFKTWNCDREYSHLFKRHFVRMGYVYEGMLPFWAPGKQQCTFSIFLIRLDREDYLRSLLKGISFTRIEPSSLGWFRRYRFTVKWNWYMKL